MSAEMLAVVREEYARVAYSHKTHEKMIERLAKGVRLQKATTAFLLTVSAGSTVDVLVRDLTISKYVTLIFSGAALFLAIFQLSTAPEKRLDQHRSVARALWLVRESYLHLIGDVKSGTLGEAEARIRRDALTRRLGRIYATAPDTNSKAYKQAQAALQREQELTFTKKEIDHLLPPGLRES